MSAAMNPDPSITINDLRNLVGELRLMARRLLLAEPGMHSFTPTALAMTALRRARLKEQDWSEVRWENRAHFFAALATAMRHALVDHARRSKAKGRDQLSYRPPEDDVFRDLPADAEERPTLVILLEEALAKLEAADRRLGDVLHQFYFLGYSIPEMAQFSGVSEKTVDRDLKRARTVLRKMLQEKRATA